MCDDFSYVHRILHPQKFALKQGYYKKKEAAKRHKRNKNKKTHRNKIRR